MVHEREAVRAARLKRELEQAWADLTLLDSIVLALRDARSRSHTSQRSQALATGLSKSTVARLESTPGRLRLDDVMTALDSTRFHLRLCHDSDGSPVHPEEWLPSELIAKDRASRRLPADGCAHRALTTPTWFTARHGYDVPTPAWTWYRSERDRQWISNETSGRSPGSEGNPC